MLKELLSDIINVDDVLFIIKSNGATSEIRSNSLSIKQNDQWITIGDNDGPCHMHVNHIHDKKCRVRDGGKTGTHKLQCQIF